jgi:hypothetical protein
MGFENRVLRIRLALRGSRWKGYTVSSIYEMDGWERLEMHT